MNAEHLIALYERVAEAPDAIARLRRFVLDLAVRGKLVEQDSADEPVSVVLRRVKVSAAPTSVFALPSAWAWVKVGSVADSRLGKMLDRAKNKGVSRPYLRNINVRWFDFDLSNLIEMPFEDDELPEFALRAGDVLICEGGEPGRAAVWDERANGIYFQKAIHRVRFASIVDPAYFVNALRASAEDGRLAESFTGTGIKHFTGKGLSGYCFPLPPLAEQYRNVAKVDELMALCDQLEAARTAREATRNRLTTASLTRLTAPDTDAETFRSHARFTLDVLPALTTRPDQIKTLRQAILNLAVQGKLVEQSPADEPASVLLRRIEAEVDSRRKSSNLRRNGLPGTSNFSGLM
jgi:type I restriction enzyme S subunit